MRIAIIVIDSGGIGQAPDSADFGDSGANTIGHTAQAVGGISLPHLSTMGLTQLVPILGTNDQALKGVAYPVHPKARGKDTLAGHWEMMGVTLREPFQTFPQGFPKEVVAALEHQFGRSLIGNLALSGTEMLDRFGPEHLATGSPIVYTSADSVLQIAAHEHVVPLATLYDWCRAAREIMQGSYRVGRIIARPFVGVPGGFVRTANRHDFAVEPPWPTMVDNLMQAGIKTVAVGKISDIFSGRGFAQTIATTSNRDGLEKTLAVLQASTVEPEFIFVNLVEFDSHFGHRRDPQGYARALKELDEFLPQLWMALGASDQLWITADHGCDPTYSGTDHTRETLPWMAWGPQLTGFAGAPRQGLQDIAATLSALFQVPAVGHGIPAQALLKLS